MKLQLPDVTLMAIDTNPALALRALDICVAQADFADSILITDKKVIGLPHRIEPLDLTGFTFVNWYCEFCLRRMARYIKTSHVLIVQWDGYIIHPEAWDDAFLQYDYIGARWPWNREGRSVGNSGFCLRSKRLLDILASWNYPQETPPDDIYVSHQMRPILEKKYGIRFAPEIVADRFAYERAIPKNPTFGFHGPFNFWRHIDDGAMTDVASLLSPSSLEGVNCMELLLHYHSLQKFKPLLALYKAMLKHMTRDQIYDKISEMTGNHTFSDECVRTCEAAIAMQGNHNV